MKLPDDLPPPKKPHRLDIHGHVRVDDYYWMRERDTPEVLGFLERENRRTDLALKPVAALRETLYREMRSRIKEDDRSVPVFDGGFHYYWRYQAGQEYPLHCRRRGTMDSPEEIYADENAMAEGHTYFALGAAEISHDQNLVVFATDHVGRRIYDLTFKDLRTGQTLPDRIESVTADVIWAADNRTVFYVRQDPETLRSYQVYRYELGSARPELVYEEADVIYGVGLTTAATREFLFMTCETRDSSEVRFLDARRPRDPWTVVSVRRPKHEYSVDHGGDRFFILTDLGAPNFRLTEAPVGPSEPETWADVVPHDPAVLIEGFGVYETFLTTSERENGLVRVRVYDRATRTSRFLAFEDETYEAGVRGLPDYSARVVRFAYESLNRPPAIFEEDVGTGARVVRKVREVPGYRADDYESRRIWATAADGRRVPISLVMRRGTLLDGTNPLLLYAYGSYGITVDVNFRSSAVSLLDRGFVYAIAHIRGGSEMGRHWYEEGRLAAKMNTFTDYVACAERLVADGYTSPRHLYAMGGSAGGLLMGAVLNLRPDLFHGAVAAVPFVDVLTTMLDETIPLTTGEYNEWGDPRVAAQYEVMRAYSPYDNVRAQAYPNLLITTGYHDSQVQYWEPAKWLAKLRDLKTDSNLLLMHTEMDAGHSGASGRFEALKTLALEYAFLLMLEGT